MWYLPPLQPDSSQTNHLHASETLAEDPGPTAQEGAYKIARAGPDEGWSAEESQRQDLTES